MSGDENIIDNRIAQKMSSVRRYRQRRRLQRYLMKLSPLLIAMFGALVGVILAIYPGILGFLGVEQKLSELSSFEVLLIGIVGALSIYVALPRAVSLSNRMLLNDPDQQARSEQAGLVSLERRLRREMVSLLRGQGRPGSSDEIIRQEVQQKLDREIVVSVDEALKKLVSDGARMIKSQRYVDDITQLIGSRLESPASRAERLSLWSLLAALSLGALGLVLAGHRAVNLTDVAKNLTELQVAIGNRSIWPYVLAQSAPWVGLIALIEFFALLLLRMSAQFNVVQSHYTDVLVEVKDRHLALKTIIEFGTAEQIVASAKSMIVHSTRSVDGQQGGGDLQAMTKFTEAFSAIMGSVKDVSTASK